MSNEEIASILQRTDAPGVRRLLHALGFPGPLHAAARPPTLPGIVRGVQVVRRGSLCAWVVRCRVACAPETMRQIVRAIGTSDPLGYPFLVVVEPRGGRITFACDALQTGLRSLSIEPAQIRASDVDAVAEMLPQAGDGDSAAALRILKALDRSRVTDRFFGDVRACRDRISGSWTGVPDDATTERDALALLLISRLVFLYFLQRRGLLDDDAGFLPRLLADHLRTGARRASFYATTLRTLFFGALNRRPRQRTAAAQRLGNLPYLNGGLFERHAAELRRPDLDLPDDVLRQVIDDLLEKYRFTSEEHGGEAGGGIDPEMLGRIFEGLMPSDRRARTGTFYTPAPVVERLATATLAEHLGYASGLEPEHVAALLDGHPTDPVAGTLDSDRAVALADAARDLRVLDPACGSGAFLLGALRGLSRLRSALGESLPRDEVRRDVVANSLYGVDLLGDATLICSLRLWLSLVPDSTSVAAVPPLPNLDRRLRQGDALVDPLDVPGDATPAALRPILRSLAPAAAAYLTAGPESRAALRRELAELERRLARTWLAALETTLSRRARELAARALDRDLFGEAAAHADAAARALPGLRRQEVALAAFRHDLSAARSLPFFSFRVHFAEVESGFDVVLSNPPWVRSHNWPPTLRQTLRERYVVCAEAGWPHAAHGARADGGAVAASGAQVDLSLLFLERSIRLLADGGTLGMLLPAKLIRSLYAGGARALLLRETRVISVEDHSLDQRAVFDADAFTSAIVARRTDSGSLEREQPVRVCMKHPKSGELRFTVPPRTLSIRPGDARAPWLLAPPECAAALRAMQERSPSIGEQMLPVRRGAMTGANDVMLVREVQPKIGDLARIRTAGFHRALTASARRGHGALIEGSVLRPALRGTDVHAWSAVPQLHVIWSPRNDDAGAHVPERLRRFLHRHRETLRQSPHRAGTLQRINEHTLGHKVVWSDLATDLRAAAVHPVMRTVTGCTVPVVPLNTVYFVGTSSFRESLLLAAYLNSLPLRTFARAVAERAKDAHFRFFAWTVSLLPLPRNWRTGGCADALLEISATAHDQGAISADARQRLDDIACRAFELDDSEVRALTSFDAWLAGRTHSTPGTEVTA